MTAGETTAAERPEDDHLRAGAATRGWLAEPLNRVITSLLLSVALTIILTF